MREKIGAMIALIAGSVILFLGVLSFSQSPPKCPSEMAVLLPSGAANATGSYSSAGNTSMGIAEADLPFDFPCPPTSEYPAKLKMAVKRCLDKAPEACRSQLLSLEAETIKKDKADMAKSRDSLRNVAGITPVTEEQFAGGTALYFVSTVRCWAAGMGSTPSEFPYMPTISFKWYCHTKSSSIVVTIAGNMSAEAAKNLAEDIASKFAGEKASPAR